MGEAPLETNPRDVCNFQQTKKKKKKLKRGGTICSFQISNANLLKHLPIHNYRCLIESKRDNL